MKHNRRFSDVELIPNGPLLLTLPELAAHLRGESAVRDEAECVLPIP